MTERHTLIFIHGMGDAQPVEHFQALWSRLRAVYDHQSSRRAGDFDRRFAPGFVDWHTITEAAKQRVFKAAFAPMEPQHDALGIALHPLSGLRTFMTVFLGDVTAYVSENDNNIRVTVWNKMKHALELAAPDGPFSIVAHSLGSVIAFDFLFNLFEDKRNLFDPLPPLPVAEADALRSRFRGLYTMGSPIGLFMLRKGDLWKTAAPALHGGAAFSNIKNPLSAEEHSWLNFHDRQDVVAYPLRDLFAINPANAQRPLHDVAVGTGIDPVNAHIGYWKSHEVAERVIADLG